MTGALVSVQELVETLSVKTFGIELGDYELPIIRPLRHDEARGFPDELLLYI